VALGVTRTRIPDQTIQYLVTLATQRCPDCQGYTADAAGVGIGQFGDFCVCPFDREHP